MSPSRKNQPNVQFIESISKEVREKRKKTESDIDWTDTQYTTISEQQQKNTHKLAVITNNNN